VYETICMTKHRRENNIELNVKSDVRLWMHSSDSEYVDWGLL
jgi:hypothetical protein